ncbi:MAG: carboxypeptidase regulatory-like domain-containing protein [Myxococcales bacterium]|nr:carboxypeptidase regulatory-like domain-containing protein [Myxococcales bacterium]
MLPSLTILWTLAAAAATDGGVVLSSERWWELVPPDPPRPEEPPGLVGVTAREVVLGSTARKELSIRATWRIEVSGEVPVSLRLSRSRLHVRSVTVDGRPAATTSTREGLVWAGTPDRSFTLTLDAVLPAGGHPEQAVLDLMPAAAGTLVLPEDWQLDGGRRLGPDRFAGAEATVSLAPVVERPRRDRLVFGEVGLGMTFGEPDLLLEARLRWRVASGGVDRVAFTFPGAGPDLQITGPQVGRWTREGDRFVVELVSEERALVELVATTSSRLPDGAEASVAVPAIALQDVFRTTTAVELARDGTLDLVPRLDGLQPTAITALPAWGSDLVRGTPTAAFLGAGRGGKVDLLRFTPAESPATLIDVAAIQAAVSEDGHVLMRAHYAVRNDRGAALRITPPPGLRPVAVRVAGEAVEVAADGTSWLVPLRKSVESVEGLLSFGVEIAFLGSDAGWSSRERRAFPLPVVDADVAVSRVTLHLPPGWRSRSRAGRDEVVDGFTEGEGITYGFAVGDVRAAQADVLYRDAVDAWMDNEFDEAQERLDELRALGAENKDVAGLQANLDVVSGDVEKKRQEEDVTSRRILEQARARSESERREQEETVRAAREAEQRGEYEAANAAYKKALDLSDKLGKLANTEDLSQEQLQQDVKRKVSDNEVRQTRQSVFGGEIDGLDSTTQPEPPVTVDAPEQTEEPAAPRDSVTAGGLHVLILDEDDLPIPGAEIFLTSPQLVGGSLSTRDDADGDLLLRDLAPGTYSLVVSRAGFDAVRVDGIRVDVGRETLQRVVLRYGYVEEITVEAKSVLIPRAARGPLSFPRPGGGKKDKSKSAEPPAPPLDLGVTMTGADAPLVVSAAQSSVVVPTQGEAVLYQHLLLPAGADLAVRVDARRSRRNP